MNEANKRELLKLIHEWWIGEAIEEDALQTRVVLTYKKGDTNSCENYRPSSLLNTLYKILAAAIQRRIEQGIGFDLQKTVRTQEKKGDVGGIIWYSESHYSRGKLTKQDFPTTTTRLG